MGTLLLLLPFISLFSPKLNPALNSAKFINLSGDELTWAQALANGHIQAYLDYYDSSSATASERKYQHLEGKKLDNDRRDDNNTIG